LAQLGLCLVSRAKPDGCYSGFPLEKLGEIGGLGKAQTLGDQVDRPVGMRQKPLCLQGDAGGNNTFGILAARLLCGACQAFLGTSQGLGIGGDLMPTGMILFDKPAKPDKPLQALACRRLGPRLLVMQDAKPQDHCAKLIAQQRMGALGRCLARGVLPHSGNRLVGRVKIRGRQHHMLRQPVKAKGWQKIGSDLSVRRQKL
jgi:hypothetical protein